jgi:hypothetical protein
MDVTVSANLQITATFADSAAPSVAVLYPNGGEVLDVGSIVTLHWNAADNAGVSSVDLYLSREDGGQTLEPIAVGEANDGSYDWQVSGPPATTSRLVVLAHDAAGNTRRDSSDAVFSIQSSLLAAGEATPTEFALSSVAPNPVRFGARIEYMVPHEAAVRLSVVDIQGREIVVLASGTSPPGRHLATWNTQGGNRPVPPGTYFVRLQTPARSWVRRIIVAR